MFCQKIALKRFFMTALAVVMTATLLKADPLSDFLDSRAINPASTSVLIVDLASGKTLASHNPAKPLIPASIMKGVTTATVLEKLGPGFSYSTPVYYSGKIRDGRLRGDIVVKGSGDPSVNSRHMPQSEDFVAEIVDALLEKGVSVIDGSIVVDESGFSGPAVNPTWAAGDLPHAYGTGSHAFNFSDNAVGKSSVKDPAAVFRRQLTDRLKEAGISVTGVSDGNIASNQKLLTHSSSSLDELMRSCMMRSDNQYAEAFLRLIGLKYGGDGSSASGASKELSIWKDRKASVDSVAIVDGSGLSRSNRVTARFMGDVLQRLAHNPYYASFFPLAGQEGTLKTFLAGSPLEGYVALKTGSMSGIQCYAGYKLDDDYAPTHLVVVMLNNMKDRGAARREVEKLLLSLFP